MTRTLIGFLAALCLAATLAAQEKPAPAPDARPPALTETQKLQLQNVMLRYELLQTQLRQVQGEAQALIKSLEVPGWTLDVQTLSYSPAAKTQAERPPESRTP
jgi:hypothetical protein